MQDMGFDMNDCRGQCYDKAANMSGTSKGLQTRIRQVNPWVPCAAHTLSVVGMNGVNRTNFSILFKHFFILHPSLPLIGRPSQLVWILMKIKEQRLSKVYPILDGWHMQPQQKHFAKTMPKQDKKKQSLFEVKIPANISRLSMKLSHWTQRWNS